MNEPWSKTIKKRSSLYLGDYESDIHETGMVGSWYVIVMCEKEPLLWTPPLPSNGQKTSMCGYCYEFRPPGVRTAAPSNGDRLAHRHGQFCRSPWKVGKHTNSRVEGDFEEEGKNTDGVLLSPLGWCSCLSPFSASCCENQGI